MKKQSNQQTWQLSSLVFRFVSSANLMFFKSERVSNLTTTVPSVQHSFPRVVIHHGIVGVLVCELYVGVPLLACLGVVSEVDGSGPAAMAVNTVNHSTGNKSIAHWAHSFYAKKREMDKKSWLKQGLVLFGPCKYRSQNNFSYFSSFPYKAKNKGLPLEKHISLVNVWVRLQNELKARQSKMPRADYVVGLITCSRCWGKEPALLPKLKERRPDSKKRQKSSLKMLLFLIFRFPASFGFVSLMIKERIIFHFMSCNLVVWRTTFLWKNACYPDSGCFPLSCLRLLTQNDNYTLTCTQAPSVGYSVFVNINFVCIQSPAVSSATE